MGALLNEEGGQVCLCSFSRRELHGRAVGQILKNHLFIGGQKEILPIIFDGLADHLSQLLFGISPGSVTAGRMFWNYLPVIRL